MNQNSPIRVLCVFSTLDCGGAESMCMNLYRHMDRNKVQFDFVKHNSGTGVFEKEIKTLGGKIYEAPRLSPHNFIQYQQWWSRFLDEHEEYKIIHGHFFTISAVYFRVAKKKGRFTVGHIHASQSDGFLKTILESQISKWTDYPIACSQEAGKWIYRKRPFTVLNNAIDTQIFKYDPIKRKRIRDELDLGDELVLGTVANLTSVKNPMGLIDIYLAVRCKCPHVKLLWVGEGRCRQRIEDRIRQEGIKESVLLLGARNDVPDLLQAMDVFLLPSFNEGLPVSVIEAQAAGLPCFVSDRVTKEVDITGLCRFLPISYINYWQNMILCEKHARENTSKRILNAGYDIQETSQRLQDLYLRFAMGDK